MTKPFNIVCEDYTVYLTVAPSQAGKSYLAKELELQLKANNADVTILSSDDIRRELLGDYSINKYDPRMLEVSSQAFNLLYAKLRNYISYPVNKKFVIIDSTGLNEQFRTDILNICRDHNYKVVCILFDYKNREDWFANEGGDKYVIQKHLDRLQKHVFKELKAKDYHKVVRITDRIDEVSINYIQDKNNLVVEGNNYTVIGDVHGCVDELDQLVSKINDEHNVPILVGDWIDTKYSDPSYATHDNAAIIDYLLANPQILTVKGNHEENLYKHINNNDYTESPFFNSRSLMSISEEYRAKFIELYNRSYTSIRGQSFIVTHAPCKSKFLLTSPDRMTNLYYTDDNKCDLINETYDDKHYNGCWPLHLFGHLTFNKPVKTKFCVGLDTGVGYGGTLTGYNVNTHSFVVVSSKQPKNLEALTKFTVSVKDLTNTLNEDDTKRLHSFIRNKTPFISGTMCPANKSEFILEDIETVLDYYKSTGQSKLLIQPKYMGSRAQVLLTKDDNKYEVYTRNGFKLRHTEELDRAADNLLNSFSTEFVDFIYSNFNVHSILLDCELMPWSFLGKKLINKEFGPYLLANKTHIDKFKEFGLFDDLMAAKKTGNEYVNNWTYNDTEEELGIFATELAKYTSTEDPYFVPFNILKIESTDKVLYSNSEFNRFNNKELLSVLNCPLHEIDVDDVEGAKHIQSLYKDIEGIVIKPYINYEHQAPYIKVRNTDYLRLVYGHDYTTKLYKWIDKKHISRKLSLSIKEWKLGNSLLDIHSSGFTEDNKEYVNNLISLMFELNRESSLDPRL